MTRNSGEHLHTTYGNTGHCRVSALQSVVTGSICSGGRSRYTLLMRPNKVETAVVRKFSPFFFFGGGHGNSIHNIIPLLKKEIASVPLVINSGAHHNILSVEDFK